MDWQNLKRASIWKVWFGIFQGASKGPRHSFKKLSKANKTWYRYRPFPSRWPSDFKMGDLQGRSVAPTLSSGDGNPLNHCKIRAAARFSVILHIAKVGRLLTLCRKFHGAPNDPSNDLKAVHFLTCNLLGRHCEVVAMKQDALILQAAFHALYF